LSADAHAPAAAPAPADLLKRAETLFEPFVELLRTMVNVDCGSYTPDGVNRIADLVQEGFQTQGWTVERIEHEPQVDEPRLGDLLVARLTGGNPDGRKVLLVGHMDTVFEDGTAAERPFAIDDGTARGPGVSDMKGGLLTGLFAVTCLQQANFDDFAWITYCCNPDEEIGSPFSGPHIREIAKDADACFVLEGARENGDIVSARKGVADLRIAYHGRSAHAGVEPERGRSAVLQAAHATIALHALNGRWPGVTVNVGVVAGGTRPNVVAERCDLHVDIRGTTAATFEEALAEIRRVAADIVVADVTVQVEGRIGFPPMEKTEATGVLAERAKAIAASLGFELRDASTGGASDANPIAAMGIPVLDGLGPIGGDDHSPTEWLALSSIPPRVALLAGLIASA
jgi:glutamate carboxypeptidase